MIEGTRLLPWFREAVRRGDSGIVDCGECKSRVSAMERQYMGCGYEPALDASKHRLTMWQPPPGAKGCDVEATVCAGYTTTLPEVREVAMAYRHWKTGNLSSWLRGPASEDFMALIVMLDSEVNALDVWRMTPSKDGGGAE